MRRTKLVVSLALEAIGSFVAPPRCAACDAPVPHLAAFCVACASTVQRAPETGSDDLSAFVYGGAIAQAVTRMKYEGRPDLARPLGDLLWRAIAPHADALQDVVVVPVPLHPSRLAERGFNQSALLARRLIGADRLGGGGSFGGGAPKRRGERWLPLALARARDTPRQAALGRTARAANVEAAFAVRTPERIRGRRVLLVDDVRTTGQTLSACTRALLGQGVAAVLTAVLARTA